MNAEAGKIHFTFAEIPKDEELARKTIDIARRALLDTFPILNESQLLVRIPTFDDIRFEPFSAVEQAEKAEMPNQNAVSLKKPGEENPLGFANYPCHVILEKPIYWNPDTERVMHISDEFYRHLFSLDKTERIIASGTLGILIMQKTLESLPISNELNVDSTILIREIARAHLPNPSVRAARETGRKNMADPEKPHEIADIPERFDMESPQVIFAAHGAKVFVIFPNETTMHCSYFMGNTLNEGVMQILLEKAFPRFAELGRRVLLVRGKEKIKPKNIEPAKYARSILKSIGDNTLAVNPESLLEAFVYSKIPYRVITLIREEYPQ